MNLENLDIKTARKILDNKEIKVKELVDFYLKNIAEKNKELNIYLPQENNGKVIFDDLEEQIKNAQEKIDLGKGEILTGIPFAIKVNIAISGKNMTSASQLLKNYYAPYDATVIKKLKKQGVIFLGYVNADEFACGGSGENSSFGATKNPLAKTRVTGGSSSGSAAAVAANMALVALGTDTGGSVRQPASFCGLVGIKPTYGRVSRFGATAMGSSLDQISPITRTVQDAQIILEVIAGSDKKDMTTLKENSVSISLENEIKLRKKIGIPQSLLKNLKPEVASFFNNSLNKFKAKGYEIVDIDLDILKYSLPVYYTLMPAELSTNLARFDGLRYGNFKKGENMIDSYFETRGAGFGNEVKRRIILGTYILSAGYENQYYNKALILREKIKEEFKKVISNLDAIIMPTTSTPAFKIGEKSNPVEMYLTDFFTISSNIIGNPAISVPAGNIDWEGEKLPFGIQIISAHENEEVLFKVAEDFEK